TDKEYISEEVQKAIDDSVKQVFGIKDDSSQVTITYNKDKVNLWTQQIIDYTIRGLNKLGKHFKYCVTAILQQTNHAGISVQITAYQDTATDGSLIQCYEINDIYAIVSVFAMAV
uniref:Dynein light chain tctex-type 1 protein n=1 Tax=Tetrahymena thermophila TaxID=5911 RepID=UPI001CC3327C|nr:Chain N, Dynein light chain tctex-type 1 protein [Tetrahymena thermophila]